ncbi:MAG: DinB family protein [Phycisphaeraceae bacterium]|nr:DinB family protein [Phycisphaeraceae bacterium]
MSTVIDGILKGWDENLEYARQLIKDVPAARMTHQPQAGMTHPAWVLAHLGAYHPVMLAMIHGERFADPKDHRYGFNSTAVDDPQAYPAKEELLASFEKYHGLIGQALREDGDAAMELPTTLARWKEKMPRNGHVLPDLMLVHESIHLGQISAWRRVLGLGRV